MLFLALGRSFYFSLFMTSARIKQLRIFFHAISALPSILYVMGLLKTWPWGIWTRVLETRGCYIVNYLIVMFGVVNLTSSLVLEK